MSKYGVISGPYFPVFGLNTEIYFVNFRIQSEYRKIRTINNSIFGHFSRSALYHFHPSYERLDISRIVNAKSSPVRITSGRNRGNLGSQTQDTAKLLAPIK